MPDIEVGDDVIVVKLSKGDRLLALTRGELEIPIGQVSSVRHERAPEWGKWWYGFRKMGSDIPGNFRAGRFWRKGENEFWCVHDPDKTVIIELEGHKYDRVIVDVDDPDAVVSQLEGLRT